MLKVKSLKDDQNQTLKNGVNWKYDSKSYYLNVSQSKNSFTWNCLYHKSTDIWDQGISKQEPILINRH